MADSQKGASTADLKKKNPSVEDDFGKDFLSSWKPAKMGKDTLDFDVEVAPRNKKKAFDFDKLDDFELGGDFDKLSSFKMDMPDLDFSSPLKKTEKPKDKSSDQLAPGKQESKREKFSFNFDFNELDSFGLDSNLLKGESKAGKFAGHDSPNHSFKNDTDQDSRSNSVTGTDVFQVQETKKVPNANMVTSKPDKLAEAAILNGANSPTPSYQNPRHHGSDVQSSVDNPITVAEENESETHNSEGCRERTDRTYPEKDTADLTSQSVSGNDSAKEALARLPTGFTSSDAVKTDSAREEDSSMRSIDSSQSRNNSPVNSYNSKCSPETRITASSNNSGEFEKHRKNKIEGIGGSAVSSEPTQGQKNVGNASATNFLQKVSQTVKNTGDIQNSSSKLLQSPLLRGSGTVRSIPMKQKPNKLLLFKTLNKSSENASEPTSSPALKQFDSVYNWKLKSASIYPVSENRESKQVDEQAENRKDGVLKSFEKCSIKDAPVITARKRIDLAGDISNSPLKTSNLLQQTTASSTAKSVIPNLVSGAAPTKGSKIITFEMKSPCLKDDRKIPPVTKLSGNPPNSTSQQEAKSVRFSERNLELPNSVSKKADPILTQKCALLRSPLKRKSPEVSTADPEFSNPLKRVMETSNGRNSFVVSQTSEKKMVPGTQTPEACHNDACAENLTSNGSPVLGRLINVELPMLIEKDGNVEKAEACAKDLDDICNMLKKKQEEAKELLVRAIVNNNALLMLNHPLFDEKVRALQRFATGLQSKEF